MLRGVLRERHHREELHVSAEAQQIFMRYGWPGNIRELVNTLERAVVLARENLIRTEDLPDRLLAPAPAPPSAASTLSLEELEG